MSFRVAQVSGVPIRIHLSCIVILLLLSYTIGLGFISQAETSLSAISALLLGAACALLLMVSLLAHEWGHVLIARNRGIGAYSVDLWLLGGESRLRCEAPGWQGELWIALGGPAVSALVASLFAFAFALLERGSVASVIAFYMTFANAVLTFANLLPAYPLDGGRAFHALLWGLTGDARISSRISAALGETVGLVAAAYGAFLLLTSGISGLWPVIVGWYVFDAASGVRANEAAPQSVVTAAMALPDK